MTHLQGLEDANQLSSLNGIGPQRSMLPRRSGLRESPEEGLVKHGMCLSGAEVVAMLTSLPCTWLAGSDSQAAEQPQSLSDDVSTVLQSTASLLAPYNSDNFQHLAALILLWYCHGAGT